jgi:hypothetical protein
MVQLAIRTLLVVSLLSLMPTLTKINILLAWLDLLDMISWITETTVAPLLEAQMAALTLMTQIIRDLLPV